MIIIRIQGGIGNQMFQYAAARCLAKNNNTELLLDLSYLRNINKNRYTYREYCLNKFSIDCREASCKEVAHFTAPRYKNKILYGLSKIFKNSNNVFIEKADGYDKRFFDLGDNCYLIGNYQNEKYFYNIKEEIKSIYTINQELEGSNIKFKENILQTNSVGIHVRGTDYLKPVNANLFSICTSLYYKKAGQHINSIIPNPILFVFSDDIVYARSILSELDMPKYFLDNNVNNSLVDLYLMSLCKVNIISNSTFSWWAAWLNNHKGKIVICPQKWFKDKIDDNVCLDSWIKIDN
jgi:hypothetical protein